MSKYLSKKSKKEFHISTFIAGLHSTWEEKEKQIHLTHLKDFELDKVFLKDEMIKFRTKPTNTTLAPCPCLHMVS